MIGLCQTAERGLRSDGCSWDAAHRDRFDVSIWQIHSSSHSLDADCAVGFQDRKAICEILVNGLARQEYRGYDSAGIGIDGDKPGDMIFFKEVGKVAGLRKRIAEANIDTSKTFLSQVSIAHTRWATHGPPSVVNCHPLRSDPKSDFTVCHNGIVTNSTALRTVLGKRGYKFESETDTEAVAILAKYIYDSQPEKRMNFPELIKTVLKELEGSFAFIFKSSHYPNEIVTARRGSPLLVGVKTEKKLKVDFVDVEFATEGENKSFDTRESTSLLDWTDISYAASSCAHCPSRRTSRSSFLPPEPPPHSIPRIHV